VAIEFDTFCFRCTAYRVRTTCCGAHDAADHGITDLYIKSCCSQATNKQHQVFLRPLYNIHFFC